MRQGVGGPNAQGQTVQQQLDWYKLIYALVEDNINSGGPLKVTTHPGLARTECKDSGRAASGTSICCTHDRTAYRSRWPSAPLSMLSLSAVSGACFAVPFHCNQSCSRIEKLKCSTNARL